MVITYLGHAGFIVETDQSVVIMDPWLSPTGAFDASWFQLPRNHHLAPLVYEKLRDPVRAIYLYVSHEHQDHFDSSFLNSLPVRNFSLVVPEFSRSALAAHFAEYDCENMIFFRHKQEVPIPGGPLKLYVDDSQLNRDSAVLLRAGEDTFLNMNDCKLFDALPEIIREEGCVKVFACQFSDATWHPTCYDYTVPEYEELSTKKLMAKFESVAKAIELIRPGAYIPSAGPVCFLDPMLRHLNTQPINIFPRTGKVIGFLNSRLQATPTYVPEMMPGDVLDVPTCKMLTYANHRFCEETAETYFATYAEAYTELFAKRAAKHSRVDVHETFEALRIEMERKLAHLSLADRVKVPLIFRLSEASQRMLRIDFTRKSVEYVARISDTNYYEIEAPSWQVAKILARELTWEEFSLTFRLRLKRSPDVYDPVLHAFMIMEAEDLEGYCDLLRQIDAQEERICIEAEGQNYSVRRYCPHQGGDLSSGWVDQGRLLTCPRHRWQFDLVNGGRCTSNGSDVDAVRLSQTTPTRDHVSSSALAACPSEETSLNNVRR